MRSVGFLPACGVLAGAIAGLAAGAEALVGALLLPPLLLACLVTWQARAAAATTGLLLCGFAAAAAALAGDAREQALRPPLRALLGREYGGFAIHTIGPEGAHDPVPVRLELLEDAGPVGDAVGFRAAARALWHGGAWVPLGGEGVRVTVSGARAADYMTAWRAGRVIEAPVTFRRPGRFFNAGVPDAETDLALDGTTLLGSVKSALLSEVIARGSPPDEAAAAVRARVRGAIARHVAVHDPVAGGVVTAVLIGDRTGLPPEIRDRLQAAGTYHVIAISGGNIAILAGMTLLALMVAGIRGRPAALLAIVVLLAYAQVVAAEPSVWRATVMGCAYLAARLADHRTPPWHAVAMAAAVAVVLRPLEIRDPGFLLSFGATMALLALVPRALAWVAPALDRLPRAATPLRWCAASLAASLAVEIVLMPVSAYAFARVTAAGLVLNLLAVPLMALVQIAGMVTALSAPLEPLAELSGWVAAAAAAAIIESARVVELVPWLARRVPPPTAATLAVYYSALMLTLVWRRARPAGIALLLASALAIVAGLPHPSWRASQTDALRLVVFDVGQSESMLLQVPGALPLVVDAGGAPFGGSGADIGRRVLAPALWAQGVRRLGALLVTHGDPDHLGGAASVLADFGPSRLWLGVPVPAHAPTHDLSGAARRRGARVEARRAGEVLAWGRARVRVLHPPDPDWERQQVRNDDSVVLEILYGDAAILLTGDVGADVERALVPLLTPAPLRVLKVAHHGSRTSTSEALLAGWRPHVAVISCGRGNTFGHPAPDVLERLAAHGVEVFRTDTDGQITVATDGHTLRVETYVEQSWRQRTR